MFVLLKLEYVNVQSELYKMCFLELIIAIAVQDDDAGRCLVVKLYSVNFVFDEDIPFATASKDAYSDNGENIVTIQGI